VGIRAFLIEAVQRGHIGETDIWATEATLMVACDFGSDNDNSP
jgi:hypothetical protein